MIMKGNVFPSQPFFRGEDARKFFEAVKEGNTKLVTFMIRRDRFLVYEYDEQRSTPLHWAALRGQTEVAKILIERNAHINSKDIISRTPLFHAAKMNNPRLIEIFYSLVYLYVNIKIVKLLLAGRANPLIRTHGGRTPYTVTRSAPVKNFLMKATLLKICLPMIPNSQVREWVWEAEGLYYFQSENDEIEI